MKQRPSPVALALAGLVAIFLLAPLLAVVPISLTPARFLTMPKGELSLIHYRELIDNPDWGQQHPAQLAHRDRRAASSPLRWRSPSRSASGCSSRLSRRCWSASCCCR